MTRKSALLPAVLAAWVCCVSLLAQAHKPSDSYLSLQVQEQQIEGQWDIALRDLDFVIGLDADGNGELTWDEVRAKHKEIAAYALARLSVSSGGALCPARTSCHVNSPLPSASRPITKSRSRSAMSHCPSICCS